ncbi:MAG: copper homeostasis protein CutC [Isosphaeraceae bacterium]
MARVVEICAQGIESALAAQQGGADRIELCEDIAVGGVTPSAGIIAVACRGLSIPVHVLIRPRGGDFLYSDAEFEVMLYDIQMARSLGASGVVFGILNGEGAVDIPRIARLIEAARPLCVTFHKAFDQVRDVSSALEELIALGVERVLTSGTAGSAVEGMALLAALARQGAGRILVMPGGRITERDIPILTGAGLNEIHIGSAACAGGPTAAARVRQLVELARA